eukprot:TRINITY_DN4972_c0_g1_i2.p1 TRINITY_DN4972_c0_g1~~TRINITY_DN4972_c0_g1_i2.p1  ORF type:complete len:536 (+),score=146.51 TRINITY_DN4972_c0_g1_i2:75-1682(+)
MIRRPPRSTLSSSSAASDVYKRQVEQLLPLVEEVGSLSEQDQSSVDLQHTKLDAVLYVLDLVYGPKASEMAASLYSTPATVLPMLLLRIQQKEQQWRALRTELTPKWEAMYAEHHDGAQDHAPHQARQKQTAALSLSVLLSRVRATGVTGLLSKYSHKSEDPVLHRMLEAAVPQAQSTQWSAFSQGWLQRFLAPETSAKLIFIPGASVAVLLLHHHAHEAIAKARALVTAEHPSQHEALFEEWVSSVCSLLTAAASEGTPLESASFDASSKQHLGSEWHSVGALPHALHELVGHGLKLLQSKSWPRVTGLWESCNSAAEVDGGTLSTEQYREMMSSLLGADCYRVAVSAQRHVTVSLCRSTQDKPVARVKTELVMPPVVQQASQHEAYPKLQSLPTLSQPAAAPPAPSSNTGAVGASPVQPLKELPVVPEILAVNPTANPVNLSVNPPVVHSVNPAVNPPVNLAVNPEGSVAMPAHPEQLSMPVPAPELQQQHALPTLTSSQPIPAEPVATKPPVGAALNPFGLGDINMAGVGDL